MNTLDRYINIINWMAKQTGDDEHEILNDFIYHENPPAEIVAELCEHYMAAEYVPIFLRKMAS